MPFKRKRVRLYHHSLCQYSTELIQHGLQVAVADSYLSICDTARATSELGTRPDQQAQAGGGFVQPESRHDELSTQAGHARRNALKTQLPVIAPQDRHVHRARHRWGWRLTTWTCMNARQQDVFTLTKCPGHCSRHPKYALNTSVRTFCC